MEDLSKRLLAAMQLGVVLKGADGHIWIWCDQYNDEWHNLHDILMQEGYSLNGKIYGGILEALDTIDRCLINCGEKVLLDRYTDRIQFLGEPGVAYDRITKLTKGNGGIA